MRGCKQCCQQLFHTHCANVVAFVKVEPALHADDQHVVDVADHELSGVSYDGGPGEAGDVLVGNCHRITHRLCNFTWTKVRICVAQYTFFACFKYIYFMTVCKYSYLSQSRRLFQQ
jgi:hypothetical protein